MTATIFTGPLVTAGNLLDNINNTAQVTAVGAGPNINYKGDGFIDMRYSPVNKENTGIPGAIPAFAAVQQARTINAIPQTAGASGNLAAAQNTTSGTALTLAAASTGVATGVPYKNFTTGAIVTAAIALDFGIELANVTASSKTVTVADSTVYQVGQPIVIANVGNSGGTTALLTFVTALASATTITVNDAPAATNSSTPLGSGLPGWGNLVNTPPTTPTYAAPYVEGGAGLFFDPTQAISRVVAVTGVSGGAGGAFTISGADIYGVPMTETITATAGATTVNGKKAWKYINSITPAFTDAHNYSFNTIDTIGLPLAADLWPELRIFYNNALITASTGFTAAVRTTPATATTGDVRGTYALQSASDGSKRLVVDLLPELRQMLKTNPLNFVPLYGVTQV